MDEYLPYLPYLILAGLIFLSAFFSGSETALFSLDFIEIGKLKNSPRPAHRRVVRLLGRPKTLLITIILGNLIVNVGLSNYFNFWITDTFQVDGRLRDFYVLLFLTPILVIFGEIFPKVTGVRFSHGYATRAAVVIAFLEKFFWPLRLFISWFIDLVAGRLQLDKTDDISRFSREEISVALSSARESGLVSEEEGQRILSVLDASETTIDDEKIPLEDLVTLEAGKTVDEARKLMRKTGAHWLFLYENEPGNITGVVRLSGAMAYFYGAKEAERIGELAERLPTFLDSMTMSYALETFLSRKQEIALVADEYGNISGALTLKHVFNNLIIDPGGIGGQDVREVRELAAKKGLFAVNGSIELPVFNNLFGTRFFSEMVETLSGYLVEKMRGYPKPEDVVELSDGIIISDMEVRDFVIASMKVRLPPEKLKFYRARRKGRPSG